MKAEDKRTSLNIIADLNTDNLSRKLRTISKHLMALANDLDGIEDFTCPECGTQMSEETLYSDSGVEYLQVTCDRCDYSESMGGQDYESEV